jgi:hypothetical protein
METVQLSDLDAAVADGPYGAPNCRARGEAKGALSHPEGYSLWRVVGELGDDAVLEWDTQHGDEVIFVEAGALDSDGTLRLETDQLERYRERYSQAGDLNLADVAEALRPLLEQTQEHVRDLKMALGD